jgi:predicted glycoside hydrolase/deacetylase ChbG (UPF0249 family)
MATRLLIVNADDLGMHEDVNAGVIAAYRRGIVRSASLMVNMPAAGQAIDLARDCPQLEIGLHLNVTSGYCLAPPRRVSLLAGGDGRFRFDGDNMPLSMRQYRDLSGRSAAFNRQIMTEFEHQVEYFLRTGLPLGHLNVHHYLSLLHPRLFETYVRLAENLDVSCRGLCYPILDVMSTPSAHQSAMRRRLSGSTTLTPTLSISNLFDGTGRRAPAPAYRDMLIERLSDVCRRNDADSVELVTHPTAITPTVVKLDKAYLWARELETALVIDEAFRAAVADLGFALGGYQQLKESRPPTAVQVNP